MEVYLSQYYFNVENAIFHKLLYLPWILVLPPVSNCPIWLEVINFKTVEESIYTISITCKRGAEGFRLFW